MGLAKEIERFPHLIVFGKGIERMILGRISFKIVFDERPG
jgi:hypothetical protein